MKSFEYRIGKLEKNLKLDKQEERIILICNYYYTDCAKKYNVKCPYLEGNKDSSNCPLYEERYKKARETAQGQDIIFELPCFKEDECPLCLDGPTTPISKSKQRDEEKEREENNPCNVKQ